MSKIDSTKRHFLKVSAALIAAMTCSGALAQAGSGSIPRLNPEAKVEVLEFFWYGCPHCYALEPEVEQFEKSLPGDVAFFRIPAIFNAQWEKAGRAFYTLVALGEEKRLHRALFDAVHQKNLRITQRDALQKWMEQQGVSKNKFVAAYEDSFTVNSQLKRARQLTEQAKLEGVPAMAVNGIVIDTNNVSSGSVVKAAETRISRLLGA